MKYLLLAILLLLLSFALAAQSIDSARVLIPTISAPQQAAMMVRCQSGSSPLTLNYYTAQLDLPTQTLTLDLCYFIGMDDTLGGSKDTLLLPALPAGTYQIALKTHKVADGEFLCFAPNANDTTSLSLTVLPEVICGPNPAPEGIITLTLPNVEIRKVWLADLSGKKLPIQAAFTGNQGSIQTDFRGMGILYIEAENGQRWTLRIIFE